MKIILLRDVASLGKEGEMLEVSVGHARNFLFPQNLAVPATSQAVHRRKEKEKSLEHKTKKELASMGKLAEKLEGREFTIQEKMTENGKLYGAVTAKNIAKVLKKAGFDVEEKMISLLEPIKEPGEKIVSVQLPHGFEAEIKMIVEGA